MAKTTLPAALKATGFRYDGDRNGAVLVIHHDGIRRELTIPAIEFPKMKKTKDVLLAVLMMGAYHGTQQAREAVERAEKRGTDYQNRLIALEDKVEAAAKVLGYSDRD